MNRIDRESGKDRDPFSMDPRNRGASEYNFKPAGNESNSW